MKARVAEWTTGIDLNTTDGRRDWSYYPTELYREGNETNFRELEMAMKMYAILFRKTNEVPRKFPMGDSG